MGAETLDLLRDAADQTRAGKARLYDVEAWHELATLLERAAAVASRNPKDVSEDTRELVDLTATFARVIRS